MEHQSLGYRAADFMRRLLLAPLILALTSPVQAHIKGIYKSQKEDGFSLVELIVVVMVIGILSSIAIPQFLSISDKARQKEPALLIDTYLKAAQAYYTEYSELPKHTRDLGLYITVMSCRKDYPKYCKSNPPRDYSTITSISWTTVDGFFDIYMRRRGDNLTFRALPVPVYESTGYGVSGCYNPQTGVKKVVSHIKRLGRAVPFVNC